MSEKTGTPGEAVPREADDERLRQIIREVVREELARHDEAVADATRRYRRLYGKPEQGADGVGLRVR